jgi:hypothetical protein
MSLAGDRVRKHTATAVLQRIDAETVESLTRYASAPPAEINRRLHELDREWDTDRVIEVEAPIVGLIGLALGVWVRPVFLALPAGVGASVFLHATTGWYPLLPLFRRLGIRSAREIARERYALKALRGDFDSMDTMDTEAATPRSSVAFAPPTSSIQVQ